MNFYPSAQWGVMSLTITCMLSFLFNQINQIVSRISPEKFQLRSSNRNRNHPTITPLISDFDLDPSINSNIPDCARDVFLTLHKEEQGGEENNEHHACRGLLIRDDIILTSSECSKLSLSFDFPDATVGILRAVPHASLNSNEEQLLDPRLGFLETNAPYHYHFVDQPVMRTRMFLSLRSFTGDDDTKDEDDAVMMTCDSHRPIAHNFPVDGELVPLGHLAHVVPDDILWKERDTDTALMLKDNSHRWWTRSVARREEEKTIKKLLKTYQGPPGSVSIPAAHKSGIISQVGGLCEAIDPRGHRHQDCFPNYFFRWRNALPFSGMHFFDWLDFGDGKFLMEKNETDEMIIHKSSDLKCFKEDFNRKKVHYFNDDERLAHAIYITPSESGKELIARYKLNDQPVPRSRIDHPHLYTWDLNGTFYIVDTDTWDTEKYGKIKHTSVLAGRPALSAGKAHFGKHGAFTGIDYASGHYRPGLPSVSIMYQWMKNKGFNVTALDWFGRAQWSTEGCMTYDWDSVEIPGYDATALNQSCHEVVVILKEDDGRR